ncbi:MAG: UDP-N-acetylmuramoyl-tripeptide--D-alanyl-D-alanine ligase [bacterium]|nr:UDP-N-acetylmuramoyl-tripeptide--D-alanyl-D-alanine ligase [bacterium]
MIWVMPILGAGAVLLSAIKWLRVAQREHYLPGALLQMRRVWIASRRWNLVEMLLVLGAVGGWILRPVSAWPMIGVVAIVIFPVGLTFRGRTSPLVWTARLKRSAALAFGILATCGTLLTWLIGMTAGRHMAGTATIASVVCSYFALDAALWLAAPVEKRMSKRFVDQASTALARVRPVVVGITGSYGKTSTKWYVNQLVHGTRRVVVSPASFNNRLGLARAVNEHLTADAEVFVAEMGTYGRGEIAELCSWLQPTVAVLTAIGPVHLQRFRSEERIVEAKSEIIRGADAVVLNVDHPLLAQLADRLDRGKPGLRVWRCGTSEMASDVRVSEDRMGVLVRIRGEAGVHVPSTGVFLPNLACAVAVAVELGVRAQDINERAARLTQAEHRQSIGRSGKGFTIIDDTFNSNPAGAARALEVLISLGGSDATRVVVTPGMVELGPRQRIENARFGAQASRMADVLVIVGRSNRRALIHGARGGRASLVTVDTREEAVEWVRGRLGPGDAVLYENDLPDHYP